MNNPVSQHIDRDLLTLQAWQADAKSRNLPYYIHALIHNQLSVMPGNEYSVHKSCCDCCCRIQKSNIRKFKHQPSYRRGENFECHFCEQCWKEITEGEPISVEISRVQMQTIE